MSSKHCPQCNRVYWKANNFCLECGIPLVSDSYDPNADTEEMTEEQRLQVVPLTSAPLAGSWMLMLECGTQRNLNEVVNSPQFREEFPVTLTAADFIDKLLAGFGRNVPQAKREGLVMSLNADAKTRAQVLREIIEMV